MLRKMHKSNNYMQNEMNDEYQRQDNQQTVSVDGSNRKNKRS